MTLVVGLTGGIACGKSAVSARLSARGAIIVDADLIAREVLAQGSDGLAEVVERWGEEVLTESGSLDRAKLGSMIFGKIDERNALEAITHPRIARLSAARLNAAREQGPPLVVYDAALLIEAGRAEAFRPLIVVTTETEIQLQRLIARDNLSEAEARARMRSQMALNQKVALADYVIYNNGDWDELDQQVTQLWETLTE